MREFFFDTANKDYIMMVWNEISTFIPSDRVVGITTNPNALYKEAVNESAKSETRRFRAVLRNMAMMLNQLKQNGDGIIYLQLPYTPSDEREALDFAQRISGFAEGYCKIGLKIPPTLKMLKVAEELSEFVEVNVTGVADASCALRCATFPGIKYISMIPGRMEEVGIDAKAHIGYVLQSNIKPKIIAGSMRTLEQLQWVTDYGCIPTIGYRVWDQIIDSPIKISNFANLMEGPYAEAVSGDIYNVNSSDENRKLSEEFFKQMNIKSAEIGDYWKGWYE